MSDSQSIYLISDLCGRCGSQLATNGQLAWCSQRCTEIVLLKADGTRETDPELAVYLNGETVEGER